MDRARIALLKRQPEAMLDLWSVYDAHYEAISRESLEALKSFPELTEVIERLRQTQDPQTAVARQEQSRALLKMAMVGGEWESYLAHTRQMGAGYARANLEFNVWSAAVSSARPVITDRLRDAYGPEPDRFAAANKALGHYLDAVLAVIGDEYIKVREEIIREVTADVEAHKRAEERIRKLNAKLERTVAEKTSAMEELAAQKLFVDNLLQDLSDLGAGLTRTSGTRIEYANEAFSLMSGYGGEGRPPLPATTDLIAPETVEEFKDELALWSGDVPARSLEWELIAADGSRLPVETISRTAFVDGKQETISVVRDITQRREAERAIQALNQDLQREVVERTASNRELEAFSYTVSHDLRAPLRAINGFVDALVEDHREELSEDARVYLDDIADNARQMARLIEDLLAFSRLGRKLPRLERVNPTAVAKAALATLQRVSGSPAVKVRIERMPPCQADGSLLHQVYLNLIGNAIKFSRTQSNPEITVGHLNDDGRLTYFVRDNGVGFNPAYADKLFGVFQRLHSNDEFEGTGVGLAIVQRIVNRHGGRAWAESKPGEGATFFFTLGEAPVGK